MKNKIIKINDPVFGAIRLEEFNHIPHKLQNKLFIKAFEIAEIAKSDRKQLEEYEQSLKYYRDIKNVVDTSFEEGRKEERILLAKEFIKNGVSIEIVMKSTGLTNNNLI
jgi:predicted transposase/invertase (TIGR01784 family)